MLLRFFLDAGASGPATLRRRRASGIGVESGKLEIPEALRAAIERLSVDCDETFAWDDPVGGGVVEPDGTMFG
ncbi:MAG: hypothetical protein ABL956_13410 [Hyphomonadaceae bacterium]